MRRKKEGEHEDTQEGKWLHEIIRIIEMYSEVRGMMWWVNMEWLWSGCEVVMCTLLSIQYYLSTINLISISNHFKLQ